MKIMDFKQAVGRFARSLTKPLEDTLSPFSIHSLRSVGSISPMVKDAFAKDNYVSGIEKGERRSTIKFRDKNAKPKARRRTGGTSHVSHRKAGWPEGKPKSEESIRKQKESLRKTHEKKKEKRARDKK